MAERRDVVEEVGAGIEGGPGHRRVAGVDRDRQREALGAQRGDDRHDAGDLLRRPAPGRRRAGSTRRRCRGCRRRPRPSPGRAPSARRGREVPPAVGEAVGGDVEHPHDPRPVERRGRRSAGAGP